MKSLLALSLLFSLTNAIAAVNFTTPKDKEVVPTTFPVEFTVEGMTVEKAGKLKAGTGHHHLIINGAPVAKGKIVPKDERHIHFGDAATSTKITLKPGKHTLTLQFADGSHMSYGEEYAKTITVEVK